jgi:hypothetical protein
MQKPTEGPGTGGDGSGRVGDARCLWVLLGVLRVAGVLCPGQTRVGGAGPHCWSSHDGNDMLVANQPLVWYDGALKRPWAWPGIECGEAGCVDLLLVLLTEELPRGQLRRYNEDGRYLWDADFRMCFREKKFP